MKKLLHIVAVVAILMSAGVLFGCDGGGGMETEPIPQEEMPQEGEEAGESEAEEEEDAEQDTDPLPEPPGN